MKSLQVIVDFDGTLMKQDVGDTLMERLRISEHPQAVENLRRVVGGEAGSSEWIKVHYGLLEGRQEEVDRVLASIYPREGAARFLEFCRSRQIPVHVLSDGMLYYIEKLLRHHGLTVDHIEANPITYDESGSYMLGLQNQNTACSWCGCCKAEYVRKLKQEGSRIIYIGDGSSDIFGSAFADWVFARAALAKHRKTQRDEYYPFETFHDVLEVLELNLSGFLSGEIASQTAAVSERCKFSD